MIFTTMRKVTNTIHSKTPMGKVTLVTMQWDSLYYTFGVLSIYEWDYSIVIYLYVLPQTLAL